MTVEQVSGLPTILMRYADGHFSPVLSLQRKQLNVSTAVMDDLGDSSKLFKFRPPSLQWILASRRRSGIPVDEDDNIKLRDNVCPNAFYGGNTSPYAHGDIETDEHCGYRALAYLIFFDEEKHELMRQIVCGYVVLCAGQSWVQRKATK